jgi:hypothetical protein
LYNLDTLLDGYPNKVKFFWFFLYIQLRWYRIHLMAHIFKFIHKKINRHHGHQKNGNWIPSHYSNRIESKFESIQLKISLFNYQIKLTKIKLIWIKLAPIWTNPNHESKFFYTILSPIHSARTLAHFYKTPFSKYSNIKITFTD